MLHKLLKKSELQVLLTVPCSAGRDLKAEKRHLEDYLKKAGAWDPECCYRECVMSCEYWMARAKYNLSSEIKFFLLLILKVPC